MRLSFKSRITFGLTLSMSVALIIIGAMLVKYKVDPEGSLFYLIGIVIAIVGFVTLLNFVSGRQKQVTVVDYLFSTGLLIVGVLVAAFSEKIQAYGMLIIGIIFVAISIIDFLTFAKTRSLVTLIVGVLRVLIGIAFITSGVSEAVTSNDDFSRRLWEVIGYFSLGVGITFLVLDTFQVVE